jgi:hypothetical protein
MTKYDQLNTSRDAKVEAMTEGYLAALERLKKSMQTTGQLELVLQVQTEIDSIAKGEWPMEALAERATPDLKVLRTKYVDAREKAQKEHAVQLSEVVDKMGKLLTAQIVDLTKAGKIEDAKLAQKMKDDLGKDIAINEARKVVGLSSSTVGVNWSSLSYDSYEVIKQDQYYVGPLIGKKGKGIEDPVCIAEIKKYATSDKNVFIVIPNCEVEFTNQKPFTEFKGAVILTRATGSASIKIKVAGKTIHKQLLKGGVDKAEVVNCKFSSTDKIILICEDEGSLGNDTVGWVSLDVR